jgi:hypothetical protein
LKGHHLVFRKKLLRSLERKLLAMRARISEALKLVYSAYQFVRGGRRRLFRALAGEREAKKERGKKRKRRARKKKNANSRFFLPPQ